MNGQQFIGLSLNRDLVGQFFLRKAGEAQYYEKRHVEYYCNICGKKRYENNKPV